MKRLNLKCTLLLFLYSFFYSSNKYFINSLDNHSINNINFLFYDNNNKTLNIPLLRGEKDMFYTSLYVGNPGQYFYVAVDTFSQYSYIINSECIYCLNVLNKFNITNSETYKTLDNFKQTIELFPSLDFSGYLSNDYIKFDSEIFNKTIPFNFFLVTQNYFTYNIDGLLGLGISVTVNKEDDSKFSLLNQLINQNIIQNRIYSFSYRVMPEYDALLQIGDYPLIVKTDPLNYKTCKLNDQAPLSSISGWSCKAKGIKIGNSTSDLIPFEYNVIFTAGEFDNYIPLKLFQSLKTKWLKDVFDKGICIENNIADELYYISCSLQLESELKNIEDFVLVFDNVELKLKEPFSVFSKLFQLNLFGSVNSDNITLGELFLKPYLLVFDKEKDEIGFYRNNKHNNGDDGKNKQDLILTLILCTVIPAIALSLGGYFFYKWRKRRVISNESAFIDNSIQ